MIISEQDQNIISQDSARQIQDTVSLKSTITADSSAFTDTVGSVVNSDTLSRLKDIFIVESGSSEDTLFIPEVPERDSLTLAINPTVNFESLLKNGKEIPEQPFNDDWIIGIVLVSAFIYATFSVFSSKLLTHIKMFLLFKGIGDPSSRERGTSLIWQSGIIDLISFSNIALFAYCAADYYNISLSGVTGLFLWLLLFLISFAVVSIRYVLCIITGNISGASEVFREYSVTIYQFYRISGFILFLLSVFLAYTTLIASDTIIFSGLIIISALYLMRILRLLLIFLKRNISILYLILYLCALEFLPVMIVIKYLTDLF